MLLFIFSMIISVVLGKFFLVFLQKKEYTQPIYEEALDNHKLKGGTPTMGGVIILGTIFIIASILFFLQGFSDKVFFLTYFLVIFGYGFIGFKDDIQKITKKDNQSGLTPKQKLILQFIISFFLILVLYINQWDTTIYFIGYSIDIGLFYYLIIPILIVGFSNATNITDGIDGLLTSVSIIIFLVLFVIAKISGNNIISYVLLSIVGALVGFFLFNKNPAKIFMGDTGSLVIGALYAYFCVLLKLEALSIILGIIFILETMSVVIQVTYFKYTKKKYGDGKRIFLVAPYHHHLEKIGWSENKIVQVAILVQSVVGIIVIWGVL